MMEGIKTDLGKFLESGGKLWQVSVGVLALVAFWIADVVQRKRARVRELDSWIAQARKERDDKQFQVLKDKNNDMETVSDMPILSATETRQQIQANKLNMVNNLVLLANRCRRYGRDQDKVNAVTQELYDEAHEQAKTLQGTKQEGLLLYGVPISVKDCIAIKGTLSTAGLACRLKSPSVEDALLIKVIKHAGAIPLVRGNTIQTMMLPESFNRIWGRTRNPWDLSRTPGGSSGGDAALVAMDCVPLAMGSDVAGSLRIPAVFCGICGFKPTSTRLSAKGNMKPRKDDRNGISVVIPSTCGPMARTVDDLALFMKAACVPEMWEGDLNAPRMPFDSAAFEKKNEKLVIGYFESDEWFAPSVAARRALQETVQNLTKAGHTCKPIKLPTNGWFNYGLVVKINSAEGKIRHFREALEGEPLIKAFNTLQLATLMPDFLRWILRKVLDERKAYLLGCARRNGISVWETWQLLADVMEMRSKWSNMFVEQGLDAVIFPALPLPAMQHEIPGRLTAAFSNMFIANILQWPSGVVPVTTVRQDEQFYKEAPNDGYCQMAHQVMENSAGLPMGVSVLAPMFQDEKCLRVMKEVETLAGFTTKPMAYKKEKEAAKTVRV